MAAISGWRLTPIGVSVKRLNLNSCIRHHVCWTILQQAYHRRHRLTVTVAVPAQVTGDGHAWMATASTSVASAPNELPSSEEALVDLPPSRFLILPPAAASAPLFSSSSLNFRSKTVRWRRKRAVLLSTPSGPSPNDGGARRGATSDEDAGDERTPAAAWEHRERALAAHPAEERDWSTGSSATHPTTLS